MVGFVYFLSDFSRSRSSDLKAFCKKNVFKRFQNSKENNVPESSFKFAKCFKKEALAQVFLCKFYKIFKKCFVEAMFCRTSTKVCFKRFAKFQATSSLFVKESVVFNCLSIKTNKTLYFLIQLPLIYFKIILPKHIFGYHGI